ARVEAEATMRRGAIVARRLDTTPDPSSLPETIVKYVLRTQETVMLDDASAPNPFSADAYLAEHRIRSLLCLPLFIEGTLFGALYFEDPLASHIFTASRIGLLTLLASQAAIPMMWRGSGKHAGRRSSGANRSKPSCARAAKTANIFGF